jgi:hypothetical protein
MSALAERPSTGSLSASVTLVLGEADTEDLLIEEPMDLSRVGGTLLSVPEEPADDYPQGTGPYGF